MKDEDWNNTLKGGQYIELLYSRYASSLGFDVQFNEDENKRSLYDLTISTKLFPPITVEIKADKYMSKTNNIAVEIKSDGRNSGIRATGAHYWCFYDVNRCKIYTIETEMLKLIIKAAEVNGHGEISKAGYHRLSQVVLLPLVIYEEWFTVKDINLYQFASSDEMFLSEGVSIDYGKVVPILDKNMVAIADKNEFGELIARRGYEHCIE